MSLAIKSPGWVGACTRCGRLLVLEFAEVDALGIVGGWRCPELVDYPSGSLLWCHGAFKELPDQRALVAAYLVGGEEAVAAIIAPAQVG